MKIVYPNPDALECSPDTRHRSEKSEEDAVNTGLVLKPGGVLEDIDWVYDHDTATGKYVATDVSARAASYLFESVRLEGDVRLKDIFLVLQNNPVLFDVYCRHWALDLWEEVQSGQAPPYSETYDPEGIEYLELYQRWYLDSATNTFSPRHRLNLHGVGFVLQADVEQNDCLHKVAGTRIHWSVSFLSPLSLSNIPLRIDPTVIVCEDNLNAGNYSDAIGEYKYEGHPLGQVIDGVLSELSFFEPKAERDQVKADVLQRADA